MFLSFKNRKCPKTEDIELNNRVTNEHIYEEIIDYYDNKETSTLSTRKKCVRFTANNAHFTDNSTLPANSSNILMPILRIDPLLKVNNNSNMFSSSISSTSSSSSSSSCGIYTNNSILSANSSLTSNHSLQFNQMVEDFLTHCTLKLNKSKQIDENNKKIKKKKKSLDSTSISSSSSNSNNSVYLSDSKCCCSSFSTANNQDLMNKLSYRVTNLTLDDLKKRQKLIYNRNISNSINKEF